MTDHTPLTNALSDQRKHTLLFFQSSGCNLCRSISSRVEEVVVVDRNSPISSVLLFCQAGPHYSFDAQERLQLESHLNLVHINTDGAQGFAPEMLQYDVHSVPCFVLLEPGGLAVAKSGKPRSQGHVTAALDELLSLVPARPQHKPVKEAKQ